MDMTLADPKGLIRESYAIEGITSPECRSVFLDWALSISPTTDTVEALRVLLAHYGPGREDHPMSKVLTDGLMAPQSPVRRGGRAARTARHGEQ